MKRSDLIKQAVEIIKASMQYMNMTTDEIIKEAEKLTNKELQNFINENE